MNTCFNQINIIVKFILETCLVHMC